MDSITLYLDYVVVIPSYKRLSVLKAKTLALLKRHNIPRDQIYIFVASEEERLTYKELESDATLITGVLGLSQQRDFISDYFPIGTKIVSFDDDVSDILIKIGDALAPISSLDALIRKGFKLCDLYGASLFGIYPVPNAFFMKKRITTDLRFIVGPFFGCINPGSSIRGNGYGEKEDYLRTIKFWLKDKSIVRFNHITLLSKVYAGSGGLQNDSRLQRERIVVAKLLSEYPQYLKPKKSKSKFPELRFKKTNSPF